MSCNLPDFVGNETNTIHVTDHFSDFYTNNVNQNISEFYTNKPKTYIELSPRLTIQDRKNWNIARKKMTNMLQVFVDICKRHDIKYFASGGTLIGAVRHNGWIPWDGDIDFGILDEDFEKFKKVQNELPYSLWLQTIDSDPLYKENAANKKLAKIRDLNSCYDEPGNVKKESHSGLQIDLFGIEKKGEYLYGDIDTNIENIKYDQIFPLKTLKFEGIDIYVPNKYKENMILSYGEYPPPLLPVKDRIAHEGCGKVKPNETCDWFAKNYPQFYKY
jgi:phosphorylcholine metabolism protein LicD